jgi:hypothetical protein
MGPEAENDSTRIGDLPTTSRLIGPRASPEDSGKTWCQRLSSNQLPRDMKPETIHFVFAGVNGRGGEILTLKSPFGGEQFDVELTPLFQRPMKNPILRWGLNEDGEVQTLSTRFPKSPGP